MFSGNVTYRGDADVARAALPIALRLTAKVQLFKEQLGLSTFDQTYPLPNGAGEVRIYLSDDAGNKLTLDVRGVSPEGEEAEENVLEGTDLYIPRWEPEGLMLTPRTEENPLGWGLPRRASTPDGTWQGDRGTEGGSIPQVLLNKFANNKYLDDGRYISSTDNVLQGFVPESFRNPRTRESYASASEASLDFTFRFAPRVEDGASVSFTQDAYDFRDRAAPGYYTADNSFALLQPALYEEETSSWYTHRPQDMLYTNAAYEEVFQATNEYRSAVGEELLNREVRGLASPAAISSAEVAFSGADCICHSNKDFSPGRRTANGRMVASAGYVSGASMADNTCENLLVSIGLFPFDGSTENGRWVAEGWRDSPPHYAAMISSRWSRNGSVLPRPWTDYYPRGAFLAVGYAGPANPFTSAWDKSTPLDEYELLDIDFPAGSDVYTQHFGSLPTWVPIPGYSREFDLGRAGPLNSAGPGVRCYPGFNDAVVCGGVEYEVPAVSNGLAATTYSISANENGTYSTGFEYKNDAFVAIAGVAPYMHEDGTTWLRVAYWKSNAYLVGHFTDTAVMYLSVVVFPAALTDGPFQPWHAPWPNGEVFISEMEVEAEFAFPAADGWIGIPDNYAHFSKDGTKFLFSVEYAQNCASEYLSRYNMYPTGYTSDGEILLPLSANFSEDRFQPRYGALGAAVSLPFEYSGGAVTQLKTLEEQQLVANVICYGDGKALGETQQPGDEPEGDQQNHYELSLVGQTSILPHYSDGGAVQYVVLDINEYMYLDSYDTTPVEDWPVPTSTATVPLDYLAIGTDVAPMALKRIGWQVNKMIFPSGKEIAYKQFYGANGISVQQPVGYAYPTADGTYDNFYAVIHHIDLPTETVIYSKHRGIQDHYGDYYTDTGDTEELFYWGSNISYDALYVLDAFPEGAGRVQDVFTAYSHPDNTRDIAAAVNFPFVYGEGVLYHDNFIGYLSEGDRLYDFRVVHAESADSVYNFANCPSASMVHRQYQGSSQYPAFTTYETHVQVSPFNPVRKQLYYVNRLSVDVGYGDTQADIVNFVPATSYNVSCSLNMGRTAECGGVLFNREMLEQAYLGPDAAQQYWTERGLDFEELRAEETLANALFEFGGRGYSGFLHNVAPLFSDIGQCRAKFAQYKDRWVARLEVLHVHACGPAINAEMPRPPDFAKLAWVGLAAYYEAETYNYPPAAEPMSEEQLELFFRTLGSARSYPLARVAANPRPDVYILSNFNIDEATGISNVTDIEPFGVL